MSDFYVTMQTPHYEVAVENPVSMHMKRLRRHEVIRGNSMNRVTTMMSKRVRRGLRVMNSGRGLIAIHNELIEIVQQARVDAMVRTLNDSDVLNMPHVLVNIVITFEP
jgi:hypothetical protein